MLQLRIYGIPLYPLNVTTDDRLVYGKDAVQRFIDENFKEYYASHIPLYSNEIECMTLIHSSCIGIVQNMYIMGDIVHVDILCSSLEYYDMIYSNDIYLKWKISGDIIVKHDTYIVNTILSIDSIFLSEEPPKIMENACL